MKQHAGRRWRRRTAVLTVCSVLLGWLGWQAYRRDAGTPVGALDDDWFSARQITDRHGELLRELPTEHGRRGRPIPLHQIGDRLTFATLAAEDARFLDHDGVDSLAILRAATQNLRHRDIVSGASTITQQLVKLLDTRGVPGARTLSGKLRESARAQNLEDDASKDAILEAYFHRLPYGHGLVGPQAAASSYFGVDPRDLSWAQAATLAVLPRSPSFLDPYAHPDRIRVRQHALLDQLLTIGLMSTADHARAKNEPVEFRPLRRPFLAPHFTDRLIAHGELEDGVTVSTLDASLQADVEGLIRTHLGQVRQRAVDNAAAIVVDNENGDVLAYAGSADFFDPDIAGQVDMLRAKRQPGSTLKPFVYGLAFEHGVHGSSMLADVPTSFVEGAGGVYAPRNFHDGHLGPISAREALATSLNVPVIRLAATLQPGALLERLHALGFKSLAKAQDHYGLALALGSGEVTPFELARAYVTLARAGSSIQLRTRMNVHPTPAQQVLDRAHAAAIVEALADPAARLRLLQGRSPFDIGYPVALKTGTSSGYRDAWTAGFTHERTVVVWLGNADGSPMHAVTGGDGAGPLFADIMRRAMLDVPTRGPLWPQDALETAHVCPLSGFAPTEACPDAVLRRFAPGDAPSEPCTVHRRARKVSDEWSCDPDGPDVVAILPPDYDEWLDTLPPRSRHDAYGHDWVRTRDVLACGFPAGRATLALTEPHDGAVLGLGQHATDDDRIELSAAWNGQSGARPSEVEFVVDGTPVGRSAFPFELLATIGPGDHTVYARPLGSHAPTAFDTVRFSVR